MGALCCCLCPEDFEEYAYSSNPIYQHCLCLRYFFHQLLNGCGETFQRLDGRFSAQIQTTSLASSASGIVSDSSLSETSHLVPRPPPYEIDPRYSLSQHEGLVLRREKSMSHILEDLHTLRRNGSSSAVETLGSVVKRNITESVEGCKSCNMAHIESEKNLSTKASGTRLLVTSSEDEDVCPTCLEEYTPENPKIVARCSHHFHLGCIYEWMERSDTCPVCGKEMEFHESPQ
ncbi:E3 ubiquitin-protein ligase At3g02290-like [Zingiber officinale]|uniref:E3 ubiquitin-protein ligase At3g02290-like n=1 Tax=Zingiber officinale TaxID=94328 RepID=UPI001C4C3A6F|nr:E3 ubiquitin-protein ligase At3g02290-like [Zingiber officinale]XP_042470806.1 E3 ubiquitin-protein ligase At3g02290-like [Zingiber officinale]XP_042470807.1 E3 ubiquitin-protein ligase At3g02290-like [Zingiber officinale]